MSREVDKYLNGKLNASEAIYNWLNHNDEDTHITEDDLLDLIEVIELFFSIGEDGALASLKTWKNPTTGELILQRNPVSCAVSFEDLPWIKNKNR